MDSSDLNAMSSRETTETDELNTGLGDGVHGSFPMPRADSGLEEFSTAQLLGHKLKMLQKASLLHQNEDLNTLPGFTSVELASLRHEQAHKWHQPRLLYFTIAVCSLGAIEQGWAQTSMNGANLFFPQALDVASDSAHDVFVVGFINGALYISVSLWGSWLSEPLNKRFGRRGAIFAGSALCLVASIGSAISWHWFVLAVFRLLLGTGLGINASTVSVYAGECAPASIRGGLGVSWQMFTAFGIFLGFTTNVVVYDLGAHTWRLQLAAPLVPAAGLLLAIYACPESPAWYIKKGRYDLAYQSLSRLRNMELLAAKEIYASHLVKPPKDGSSYLARARQLFTMPRIRNATIASGVVMLSQQLCGINIIAFYSSTIFSEAGFSTFNALLASCIFGLINFLGAFPAVLAMDTLGRRSLLLWSLPPMALTMLGAGFSFQLPEGNLRFGLLAALIYLFCAEYSPGMGPVPCAYSAEVFPLSHREVGMSLAVATANFWAAVLSLTFPALLARLGSTHTFALYGALNMVAFGLVFVFVRETKKRTLDELDEVFDSSTGAFARSTFDDAVLWFKRRFPTSSVAEEYVQLRQDDTEHPD